MSSLLVSLSSVIFNSSSKVNNSKVTSCSITTYWFTYLLNCYRDKIFNTSSFISICWITVSSSLFKFTSCNIELSSNYDKGVFWTTFESWSSTEFSLISWSIILRIFIKLLLHLEQSHLTILLLYECVTEVDPSDSLLSILETTLLLQEIWVVVSAPNRLN